MFTAINNFFNIFWYNQSLWRWVLWPLSLVFQLITFVRRIILQRFCQTQFAVPIIVVGNISVGGVGKTPLVIALAQQLKARGLKVGIVSRGYGAKIKQFPYEIAATDEAAQVGDEPFLLAKRAGCPVVIATKRVEAVQYLLQKHQSQIIISDDGLQHYKMSRNIEIVVIDGTRGFGNGMCLPAGPLRENQKRLKEIDFIVVNEGLIEEVGTYSMVLIPGKITQLTTNKAISIQELGASVAAIAAIGNPQRFFKTLQSQGIPFNGYSFPDHYAFKAADLCMPEKAIVMTEKDAVKCLPFAQDSMYFLPVEAKLCAQFWEALWKHEQLQGYV